MDIKTGRVILLKTFLPNNKTTIKEFRLALVNDSSLTGKIKYF